MPLYREWSIDEHTLAAIWKVAEPMSFFAERTGLEPNISNEKRKTEHLAGRFLLKHLKADFPLLQIQPDEHDKPQLINKDYHFSISHSWPYIAVILSKHTHVGIDIQTWHPQIQKIQHKFLSPEEQALFQNDTQLITLAWCAKEAVYKWQGRRGVEFIEQLPITFFEQSGENINISISAKLTADEQAIGLKTIMANDFACAYVVSELHYK